MSARLTGADAAETPALLALWQRATGGHLPLGARLWRQAVADDPNWHPDDLVVARAPDGMPVGFALARLPRVLPDNADLAALGDLGWVMALAVEPTWAGRGIGGQLLAAAEGRLRAGGAARADLGGAIGHLLPGPPQGDERALRFWRAHGYTPARAVHDLRRELVDWESPPPPAALRQGWTITPGAPGEEAAILAFLARAFPGRWRYHLAQTLARGGAAGDILLLRDPAGALVGFLASWRPNGPIIGPALHWGAALGPACGGIGPLGLDPAARGHGLGLALVAAGVEALRAGGMTACAIDWVGDELLDFYGRLGFRPWRSYWRCAPKAL